MRTGISSSLTMVYRSKKGYSCGGKFAFATALAFAWLAFANAAADVSSREATSAREWLVQAGLEDSEFESFQDGLPLQPDEHQSLLKILYRLPSLRVDRLHEWTEDEVPWDELLANTSPFRARVFRLDGQLLQVQSVRLDPDDATRWGFDQYYRLSIRVEEFSQPLELLVRKIPESWTAEIVDQPIGAHGLFVRIARGEDASDKPIFAASRVSWFPDRVDPSLGVDASHVRLAELRMDFSLFEDVRDRIGLVSADRECFYQLLAAVGRSDPDLLESAAKSTSSIKPLLTDYRSQRGKLVAFDGRVRRAVKISVNDEEIQQRFGFDHYYELNVFVEKSVKIKRNLQDQEGKIYHQFPVVFCVRRLPEGMPVGEEVNERVRLTGFFFKLYAYRSEFTETADGRGRQYSPLLVGLAPRWIPYARPSSPRLGILFGGLFIVALVGIWYGLWKYHRGDESFRRSTLSRQFDLTPDQSFDDLEMRRGRNDE